MARPAFSAARPGGGWRDWWTLLHPPYTAWHLSYVVFGAAVAPVLDGGRLGAAVLGFFLGVGITAHALDELRGRPRSSSRACAVIPTPRKNPRTAAPRRPPSSTGATAAPNTT